MDDQLAAFPSSKGLGSESDFFDGSEYSINCRTYSKSLSYTKHYNTLKTKYKIILLLWVLATFIAFCYVLCEREMASPIDKMIPFALVAIFSSRGVLLLLLLDAEIYHRLLNSAFSANLEMEMKGLTQSRIHRNMMKSLLPEADPKLRNEYKRSLTPFSLKLKNLFSWAFTGERENGLDPVFYDGLFYSGVCFFLWVVAGASISAYLYYEGYPSLSICCGVLTPFVSLIVCVHLTRKTLMSGIKRFESGNRKINSHMGHSLESRSLSGEL